MRLLSFSLFIRDGNKGKFILKLLEGKIYIYPKLGLSIHPAKLAHPTRPTQPEGSWAGWMDARVKFGSNIRVYLGSCPTRPNRSKKKKKHTHTHTQLMYRTSEIMVENKLNLTKLIREKVHITSLFYKELLHNCGSVCVFVRGLEFGEDLICSLFRLWICASFLFFFFFFFNSSIIF